MAHAKLQEATGFASLTVAILSLIHAYFGRVWRGHRMGNAISPFSSVLPTFISGIALLIAEASLLSLYLYDLLIDPEVAGNKNEIVLCTFGVLTMCWTGFIGTDRRRRIVASKIASIPCFGSGCHDTNHQLLNLNKSSMLHFDPKFISSQISSSDTLRHSSSVISSSTEVSSERGKRRSSTIVSFRKRKVWELPCRTGATWIFGRAKRQAWPLNVVRTYKRNGKRFLLIRDRTVQDGAGAVLLHPDFLTSRQIDKLRIARVVFEAVQRSRPCVLRSWSKKFDGRLFQQFSEIPAIVGMLTGEIRSNIDRVSSSNESCTEHDTAKCYITEVIWAIIVVEILDYLQHKRSDLPFLTWFTTLPVWICGQDISKVEQKIDSVFLTWKAGRVCGKFLSKPCDSECCCHSLPFQNSCGCQCSCVCNCT